MPRTSATSTSSTASVPGTGRERNTVWDSGDVLALLGEVGVNVVLSGHKHVPFVWLLNDVLVVNSGTVSSHRLRGYVRPSYNLLEITEDRMVVTLRYPGTGERHAGGLVDAAALSRWKTQEELTTAIESRAVAESMVRILPFLQLEPVIRMFEIVE